jgi:hypothetical protein
VGANPAYITEVSERRWYHLMGLAVVMVSIFAFIGAVSSPWMLHLDLCTRQPRQARRRHGQRVGFIYSGVEIELAVSNPPESASPGGAVHP